MSLAGYILTHHSKFRMPTPTCADVFDQLVICHGINAIKTLKYSLALTPKIKSHNSLAESRNLPHNQIFRL